MTLNKPDSLSALSDELHLAVCTVWQRIASDWEARVVVLTGAGTPCVGGDVDRRRQGLPKLG
ncbi:hypothetical protein [Mycobacterium sp. MMS18-G62]